MPEPRQRPKLTALRMGLPSGLKLGTLGSAATFAGEATARLRFFYPEFGEPVFLPTMDACWDAIEHRQIDIGVLGVERTGQLHHGEQVLRRRLHVCAAIALPLHCSLYVKRGTPLHALTSISGHGSVYQCTRYLDTHFPKLPREMHPLNSVEAARAIVAGNGEVALVGSRSVGTIVDGLELVAEDIDDGAVSNWWAISARPYFEARPDSLIVGGRFGPDASLSQCDQALQRVGFRLAVAGAFPSDTGVSTYDYLLTFVGNGALEDVQQALRTFVGAQIIGAFKDRTKTDI